MPKTFKRKSVPPKEFYTVRDIISYRIQEGKQWFLIHWKGYSKAESTWETLESLQLDEGVLYDAIQQWREAYREQCSRDGQKSKMGKQYLEECSKQKDGQVSSQVNKKNDDVWLKLTEYLLKQSNLHMQKEEPKKEKIQISEAMSQDIKQVENQNEMQEELTIIEKENNSNSLPKQVKNAKNPPFNNKYKIGKNKKIKRVNVRTNIVSKTNEKQQCKVQRQKSQSRSIFEGLPVTKVIDKIKVRGQVMYELQLTYKQIVLSGTYFQQKYVKQLWPSLLSEFQQNRARMKKQSDIEVEH